eukprot:tig00000254_g22504.t1
MAPTEVPSRPARRELASTSTSSEAAAAAGPHAPSPAADRDRDEELIHAPLTTLWDAVKKPSPSFAGIRSVLTKDTYCRLHDEAVAAAFCRARSSWHGCSDGVIQMRRLAAANAALRVGPSSRRCTL